MSLHSQFLHFCAPLFFILILSHSLLSQFSPSFPTSSCLFLAMSLYQSKGCHITAYGLHFLASPFYINTKTACFLDFLPVHQAELFCIQTISRCLVFVVSIISETSIVLKYEKYSFQYVLSLSVVDFICQGANQLLLYYVPREVFSLLQS